MSKIIRLGAALIVFLVENLQSSVENWNFRPETFGPCCFHIPWRRCRCAIKYALLNLNAFEKSCINRIAAVLW